MTLQAGTRIGPYEIAGTLGAGGMGEVYRATDTNLKRAVAIKVLPESVATDRERLARFQREAEVLASLNHPNIAAIYGLERSAAITALVIELVEGPTLADRIAQGPIPVDEALPIAKQIAEALEAAHEQGIVHRDLKAANIKLRRDGTVKVLDFGLAKTLQSASIGNVNVTASPTITSPALVTGVGTLLGTAGYMSPEQAKGREADKRSDLWAFGCVVFEMLSGRPAFGGDTVTEMLARVIEREPGWSALPIETPLSLRRVLRRCLEKDPRDRMHHPADVRIELNDPDACDPTPRMHATPTTWRRVLPWFIAATAAGTALVLAVRLSPTDLARGVVHFDMPSPPNVEVQAGVSQSFALSSDARLVAFVGARDGIRRLFVRSLTQPDLREIPGISNPTGVAFSPDGEQLAFASVNEGLSTYTLGDSSAKPLVTGVTGADYNSGMAWDESGIVFVRENTIWLVSPTEGNSRRLTTLDAKRGEIVHADPIWLPGGRVVLFSSLGNQPGTERLESVTIDGTPQRSVVIDRAKRAAWSPTGHLLFDRDGALLAVPFDPSTVGVTGRPTTVIPPGQLATNLFGGVSLQVTSGGALMYVPAAYGHRAIVRVTHDGSSFPLDVPPGKYTNPRLSPDGRRLAVDDSLMSQVIIDLERGTMVPLQSPAIGSGWVTWNSNGTRLIFRRFNQPFAIAANGGRDGAPVPHSGAIDFPSAAGPDPDSVLIVRIVPETSGDVYLLSASGAFMPRPLVVGRGYQGGPQLSSDHRWLLYQSDESGEHEICVRPYPALDRAWQVSVGGGVQGRWSREGREIVYRAGLSMMSVAFNGGGDTPNLGKPVVLFSEPFSYGQGISVPNYDVGSDGRFIMLRPDTSVAPFHVILGWTEELKRLVTN